MAVEIEGGTFQSGVAPKKKELDGCGLDAANRKS